MSAKRDRLIYLAGTLYTRAQALNALLREMAASGENQGEIRLTHRDAEGNAVTLHLHIDGLEFTLMPGEPNDDFRLDVKGSSLSLE